MVPDTAVAAAGAHHHKQTFGDFFAGEPAGAGAGLCPLASHAPLPAPAPLQQQWAELKRTECETNKVMMMVTMIMMILTHVQAYCWMNCLELPAQPCSQPETTVCTNAQQKQCCTGQRQSGTKFKLF